jgi:hypothetical protein
VVPFCSSDEGAHGSDLKTEVESLKADQQKLKHSLRAEIRVTADALAEKQAALA